MQFAGAVLQGTHPRVVLAHFVQVARHAGKREGQR